jgi:hypothetical protein
MGALGHLGGVARHRVLPSETIADFGTFAWALEIALGVPTGRRSMDSVLNHLKILCKDDEEFHRLKASS